jgi:hypothetical protein
MAEVLKVIAAEMEGIATTRESQALAARSRHFRPATVFRHWHRCNRIGTG